MTNEDLLTLKVLLSRRLELIADHRFRDLDRSGHLAALQQVSELIQGEHLRLKSSLPPRLNHFLQQASFSKALDYLSENQLSSYGSED
jgi:hypothetical protein